MTVSVGIKRPVSATLESQLRDEVRQKGILLWLDLDNNYSQFVDGLMQRRAAGEVPFGVYAFRGSHLDLMMQLEGIAGGVDKVPLVIHLPGFKEESVRQTPLLEMYESGVRFRRKLDTLIGEAATGRVLPDEIAAFAKQPNVTLERADVWLAAALSADGQGSGARLRSMSPMAALEELLLAGPLAQSLSQPDGEGSLWTQFSVWTGLPDSWRALALPPGAPRAEDVAFAAASWALCVEYVDDLKRDPVNSHLRGAKTYPRGIIDTCRSIAAHLRHHHAAFYERTADEAEDLLIDEVQAARAEDLGKIDTFRFEEDKVLVAALNALRDKQWAEALDWAQHRISPKPTMASFWLGRDPARQAAWQLVHDAATLGQCIERAGESLASTDGLEGALEAYVTRGAMVDQAHRHLEQKRAALLFPKLPEFEALRARLDGTRVLWRQWADAWARDFNSQCRAHGFLPAASLQQRTLFDDVVRPMTQQAGVTAYFVVDAMRYEMADELRAHIGDTPATTVQLKARFAELPSVTEVGMNVLAPVVANGRLRPALSNADGGKVLGFAAGEFRVADAETRKRAMHGRVGGDACPWLSLEDVVNRDVASLRRSIAQAKLVVVHNREIDEAGEAGVGPSVFEDTLQKLRAAWHLLRDAGVRRFVFASDHGFLLLDDTVRAVQPHGRRVDPKRRHIFSSQAADTAGEVRVALADLGYEGLDGQVIFPETTAVFDTGRRATGFVHGGNSLQERVIPVLTVVHRSPAGGSTQQYTVSARLRDEVAGMHCLEIKVDVSQGALDFGAARDVELALRIPERSDVIVELCQARHGARIVSGALIAAVGQSFEVFFRLTGPQETRVRVEVHHPGAVAEVTPCSPDVRFRVTALPVSGQAPALSTAIRQPWLDRLPEGGAREVFAHLEAHGAVTEGEAMTMLGGARGLRRFSLQFDSLVSQAPWGVRIDVVSGVKRFVREGNNE